MRSHRFLPLALGLLLMVFPASSGWAHGWGRPHVSVFFSWPWGYGTYYPPVYYPYYPVPYSAKIDTDIHPEDAEVWLDGHYIGIADQYDGFPRYLTVSPGRHRLEFRLEGYRTLRIDLRARRGALYRLDRHLREAGDREGWREDRQGREYRYENGRKGRGRHAGDYEEY